MILKSILTITDLVRKFLILFIILVVVSDSIQAQKKWHIAPVVGVNATPIKYEDINQSLLKAGVSVGAQVGFSANEKWRFNLGMQFNQRQSNYSFEEPTQVSGFLIRIIENVIGDLDFGGTDEVQVNTTYWTMDFPLTVDYKFNSGVFLTGGFSLNTLISAKNETETTTHIPIFELIDLESLGLGTIGSLLPQNGTTTTSNNSTDGLSSSNVGFIAGIGADIGRFQFKTSYEYGFIDIRNDESQPLVSNPQLITLHLSYLFFPSFKSTGSGRTRKMKPRYDLELIK